jgi:hypothetical protein
MKCGIAAHEVHRHACDMMGKSERLHQFEIETRSAHSRAAYSYKVCYLLSRKVL